jgi:hypothetical protein
MKTNHARMETKTDASSKKVVVYRMDIHQARTEAIQEDIISKTDAHQERWETI